MPLTITPYEQKTTVSQVGLPRASAPALVSPIGAAVQEFAHAYGEVARERYQYQREMDLVDRLGKATSDLGQLQLDIDKDPDFRTSTERFREGSDEIRDKYLEGVKDQAVITAFRKQFQQLAISKGLSVQKGAWQKEQDYNVSTLDQSLDTYASAAANAKNPAEAAIVEQQARLAISAAQNGGWISAVDAGKRERHFLEKRDEAVVRRDINLMPEFAATRLEKDPEYGKSLNPVTREILYRSAVAQGEHMAAMAEKQKKADIQQTQETIVQKLADNSLTVRDIIDSNLPAVGDGSKEHFLNVLRTRSKEAAETPIRTTPSVMLDLFERIHLPDGDPRKITDENQVTDSYLKKQLSFDDMGKLRKEIADSRTETGQRLSATRESFFKAVKPQLDKSTMFMVDPKGGEAMYRFQQYALEQEAQLRKEGKTQEIYQLYNPNSPTYLGKSLPAFQRSLEEQVRDMAGAVGGGQGGNGPTPLPANKPVEIPASALAQLREGVATTFKNGQVWTLKQGQPVRVK